MRTLVIRRPAFGEHAHVRAIVQAVVDETYGGLWAPPPLPVDEEDWSRAWVADSGAGPIGMILTHADAISDLWVLREWRGVGAGRALLAGGEAEVASRGHGAGRLRVVRSNANAIGFYARHGWRAEREFPHERLPITMVEMTKRWT